MKKILLAMRPMIDVLCVPFVYPAACLLKGIRRAGVHRMPLCKRALMQVGVFPIRNHYYEPLFDCRSLRPIFDQDRRLPGIDWNDAEQLNLLEQFHFQDELKSVSRTKIKSDELSFYVENGSYESGDAEYWYNLIRLKKPAIIVEVGSGYSTLMAIRAIRKNEEEDSTYRCKHICIEPYEKQWLAKTRVTVIRQRLEDVDRTMFDELGNNDILFIDSSHIIRPQGDVLIEYLDLLPSLRIGVIVHVHDIFSPKDYRKEWVVDEVMFWNEQYLVEAFLTNNRDWKVLGALNYLRHHYYDQLRAKCPFLTPDREPGSLYLQKIA